MRRGVLHLFALAAFLGFAGSAQAGSVAEQRIDELFWTITLFALLVAAIVYGALFYFLWRYRRGASSARPGQTEVHAEGHPGIELVWTAFPTVILIIITAISFPVLFFTDTMPPADVTIHVTAERFSWNFAYEERGVPPERWVTTVGEAWFQRGIVVHFKVTSKDVAHSFAIPQIDIKIDAIPHKTTTAWTRVDVAGDYINQCAEFCGVGHYGMRATIHVFNPTLGRGSYGPPPTTLPFTNVVLRGFGNPPWNIAPPTIETTSGTELRLRIWNNNSQAYVFRIDSPVDRQTTVPAFGNAWLNTTINVTSEQRVRYGPTDMTARNNGMVGELNVSIATVIDLTEFRLSPSLLNLSKGPVKFLLRNLGGLAHNFAMGGVYGNITHLTPIPPGQSVVTGRFDLNRDASGVYWCAIPGHREAGMEASYIVGEGGETGGDAETPLFEMSAIAFAISVPATLAYVIRHARRRES